MPEIKWKDKEVLEIVRGKGADYIQDILFKMKIHASQQMAAEGSPSAPGHYPGVVTSRFMTSLATELDRQKLEGRFGTNVRYAIYLELGTSKMAARPWAVPTLEAVRKQLK